MKIVLLILCCVLGTKSARAMLPAPFIAETNQPAAYASRSLNEARQQSLFLAGKMARLEHEMDRLEMGFLVLAVLEGSAGASVCLLAVRDLMSKRIHAHEKEMLSRGADDPLVGPAVSSRQSL